MAFTFDGDNKRIYLPSGVNTLSVQELYSDWKEWVGLGDNSKYLPTFSTIGGDPISSTVSVGRYFFILNDWKIKPYEADHVLAVDGNLFVDGGVGNPFTQPSGTFNILINLSTSNQAVLVQGSGETAALTRIERKVDDITALVL